MKKREHGFTLIEVAIFLAVTGALFVAVTIGVQNSIYQQRYNDTVQNFVDFLSGLYSEVANVQSDGSGRSGEAIYGKLVTFGEKEGEDGKQIVYVYNVVAKAVNSWDPGYSTTTTLDLLRRLNANAVRLNDEGTGYVPVGIVEEYTPRWAARIQNLDNFDDYTGSLLLLRSAQTGEIWTYASPELVKVNEMITTGYEGGELNVFQVSEEVNLLDSSFGLQQVDFCVNPNGSEENNVRTDVRIIRGAHDASGVEMVSFDSNDNKCNNRD